VTAAGVFAPGKLFVIGEYAVLHGGRALVAALDAGIACRLESASAWRLSAPDLGVDASLDRVRTRSGTALLAAAVEAGGAEFGSDGARRVVVRGAGSVSQSKHGLGGSAASVVAVLGAFADSAGPDLHAPAVRDRIFRTAFAVHRRHQHGRGSGADVAAAVYGGWVDYTPGEGAPRVAPAAMPAEARIAVAWSGVASDTARAIGSFDGAAFVPRLRAILGSFWKALERTDRAAMLDAVNDYGAALEEMAGGAEGATRVAELVRVARRHGFAAKGSGAIGGDCAIVLAFDSTGLGGLEAEWRRSAAQPLAVSLDREGVRREEADA
jgi:phosphomevalonate kinase